MSTVYETQQEEFMQVRMHGSIETSNTHLFVFPDLHDRPSPPRKTECFERYFITGKGATVQGENPRDIPKEPNTTDIYVSADKLEEITMRKTAVVCCEIETSKNQEARRVAKMKAKKAKKKAEFEQIRARMGVSEGKEKQKSLLEQLQFRQHLHAMKKKPAILGAKKRHFKPQRESATKRQAPTQG